MIKFRERPYDLLFLSAILILIASFFTFDRTFDIHLHDTFYVVTFAQLFRSAAILLLILWILYLVTVRFLFSKVLIWVHIVFAIVSSLFFLALNFYADDFSVLTGMPRRYFDLSSWNTYSNILERGALISLLLAVIGLLIYVVNLIVGLFKFSK